MYTTSIPRRFSSRQTGSNTFQYRLSSEKMMNGSFSVSPSTFLPPLRIKRSLTIQDLRQVVQRPDDSDQDRKEHAARARINVQSHSRSPSSCRTRILTQKAGARRSAPALHRQIRQFYMEFTQIMTLYFITPQVASTFSLFGARQGCCASGGVLSFSGERKYPKNAALNLRFKNPLARPARSGH